MKTRLRPLLLFLLSALSSHASTLDSNTVPGGDPTLYPITAVFPGLLPQEPLPPGDPEPAIVTLLTDGFEGPFPGTGWTLSGAITWGSVTNSFNSGARSVWCAGSTLSPTDGYADNMDAWMVYGPIDLSNAIAANVTFYFKNHSEGNLDEFSWMASTNGTNFYGNYISGKQNTWQSQFFDLSNVSTLGNVCGNSRVWIAFRFSSDETTSGPTYTGAYVDDVVIQKDTNTGMPDIGPYQPANWNDKIVVGTTAAGMTDPHNFSGPYADNEVLYFNWATVNTGTEHAGPYSVHMEVTGTGGGSWDWSIATNSMNEWWALSTDQAVGPLSNGSHTFKLWVDYNNSVVETNESNNYYERTINVVTLGPADIRISPLQLTFDSMAASVPGPPAPSIASNEPAQTENTTRDFAEPEFVAVPSELGPKEPEEVVIPASSKEPQISSLSGTLGAVWKAVGPAPCENGQVVGISPNNPVCGAIHTLAPHPTNANILYIGAVNGGIWKTTNATASRPNWIPLTDTLPSLSIGSLEFDPGDTSHQTLIMGSARVSSFGAAGGLLAGVWITRDGGTTWRQFGSTTFANENVTSVAARGNLLMAASDSRWSGGLGSGLFRSTNWGTNFTKISGASGTGLPIGAVSDLFGNPSNTNQFYAAVPKIGVYRSDNGGANWVNITAGITNNTSTTDKMEFAMHNSPGTNVIYLGVINSGKLNGVFRSTNQGTNWTAMDVPAVHQGSQGYVHFAIAADPVEPNIVYIAGDRIANSPYNGYIVRGNASLSPGSQFVQITSPSGPSGPHADSREMMCDASGTLIQSDDGGIYRNTSPRTGNVWSSVIGNLQVGEAHNVAYDRGTHTLIAGFQDNGTSFQPNTNTAIWTLAYGGDGGDVAVDVLSSPPNSIRYLSSQNLGGFQRRTYNSSGTLLSTVYPALTISTNAISTNRTFSGQFATPVVLNEINPVRLILGGSSTVYESYDRGQNLTPRATLTAIRTAIAYGGRIGTVTNADLLYVGASSSVYIRTNATGTLVATPTTFPGGTVRALAIDSANWRRAFVCSSTRVYVTTNAGSAWTQITGNLTGFGSIRSAAFVQSPTGNAVVIGCDTGVYLSSTAALGTWYQFGVGLPNVPVYDLDYDSIDDVLAAGTLGRGTWLLSNVSGAAGGQLFTIYNDGTADLSITSIVAQTSAPWISWTPQAPFTITPGSTRAVAVSVNYTNAPSGQTTTRLLVGSNDPDENPYPGGVNVVVVKPLPEIDIRGNGRSVTNNDVSPDPVDYTDFGSVEVAGGSLNRTFHVTNSGPASLTLTGNPKVQLTGDSDFTVFSQPATVVVPGGSTIFIIKFDPTTNGLRSATVTIANDDADENPYTFSVRGVRTTPASIGGLQLMTNKEFRFTITGGAGQTYDVEYSTNLPNWLPLVTLTNTSGSVEFIDVPAINFPRRFYRSRLR